MPSFTQEDLCAARVVNEDDDFLLLEVGKHEGVKFTFDQETPDRFFIVAFVKVEDGEARIWKPWEEGA